MTYRSAVESLDLAVVEEAEIGTSSRGDWVAVVVDSALRPNTGGLLIQPYGCCSSCDEWDATGRALERVAILRRMIINARWFKTPEGMRNWMIQSIATEAWSIPIGAELPEFIDATLDALDEAESWSDVYDGLMARDRYTCVEVCRESDTSEMTLGELESAYDA